MPADKSELVPPDGKGDLPAPNSRAQIQAIGQFMKNQSKELDLKKTELDIEASGQANSHDYAKAALEVQATDRRETRAFMDKDRTKRLWFSGALVFALLCFSGMAMFSGNKDLIVEMMKLGAMFAGGAGGGYIYARNKYGGLDSDASFEDGE